ncbi:hypothetical protein AnigIFM60653_005193 [Aspergillus niger]|uniref:ATP phosphoribosyltransferase n=1 Tax=Aspergillus welwitschiae TaxID=1341132 RepID=A0A3F3Q8G0_9EURO|nr:GTP cyclohydrolase 1 type 2/Nif3 [Aspergillus welwitschiae]RDH35468.1 GTP cyclohydrolase 1 type 2/Nif3 [Aspergillus welwitschiae]GKZ73507.1 hypothetical protein AnigIFM50267_010437 [Aspergillus niger]GKZ99449.1 hypothetical protein AnigIFM60653_005193 [Aspergillus niger]GLA20263.1 hypothetical protein AnigIFM62618_008835 [Aspergillus niger]
MPPTISPLASCIPRTPISRSFRNFHSYRLSRTLSPSSSSTSSPFRSPLSVSLPASSTRLTSTSITNTTLPTIKKFSYQIVQNRTMSAAPVPDRYKLVFFVPHSHLEACKEAVFATGAGTFPGGKYRKCCFQMPGQGQFLPSEGANPAIGEVGTIETVEEMKVEVMCLGRSVMLQAVEALIKAHPYEEVAYEVYKMENV